MLWRIWLGAVAGLGFLALLTAPRQVLAAMATTDPTGFLTVSVGGGTVAAPKSYLVAASLVTPVLWSGEVTASTSGGLTVPAGSWAAGQFSGAHYVEIISGPYAGAWTDIVSSGTDQIVLNDDLSALAAPGTQIAIRKFLTLAEFLGAADQAGLKAGTSVANADEVQIYNGATPSIYWYYDGTQGGTAGWYTTSYQSANNVPIAPGQGIQIRRKAAGSINFTVAGTVKRGPTSVVAFHGLNVLNPVSPVGVTLANSGLFTGDAATGVTSGTSLATTDQVSIYNGATPSVYWHYNGTQGGTAGWYDSKYTPSDGVVIPPGSSFALQRKNTAPFNWIVPSQIP